MLSVHAKCYFLQAKISVEGDIPKQALKIDKGRQKNGVERKILNRFQ